MIGFTVEWDPFGEGMIAHKRAETGLLDGRVCAAFIEYAAQTVALEYWETSVHNLGWSLYPALKAGIFPE